MNISRVAIRGLLPVCLSILMLMASCIPNADEDEFPFPLGPEETGGEADTATIVVDPAFTATLTLLQREWMAEYVGYDPMQNTLSGIRRLVLFSPLGFYDSHVQGVVNIADSVAYKEFEHEHGTYAFDETRQLMTYTVEYDSLLNYLSDQLEYNPGKLLQGKGIFKTYDETIRFTVANKDGRRDWAREDENLRATDDHAVQLIYRMRSE